MYKNEILIDGNLNNPTVEDINLEEIIKRIEVLKLGNNQILGNIVNKEPKIEMANKVTVEQITSLVNAFKLPDAIKDLPKFDGDRHTLHDFIANVDEIVNDCKSLLGHEGLPIPFIRAIRNKISGQANEVLSMYGTPLAWSDIKQNLITHYADKRNETSLIRDLHGIYQANDTVERYFSRIIDIQSTILTHIKINEENEPVIKAKQELYRQMCLATFLAGLKEPLGSMIRAWQPKTINEAFSLCLNEQNMHYIKNKTQNSQFSMVPPKRIIQPHQSFNSFNVPRQPFTFQPRLQISQSRQPQFTHFNHQFFSNPNLNYNQTFRPNYQQNFNPNRNHQLSIKPQIQYGKPIPMDTTSNQDKYKQPTKFQANANFGYNRPQHPFQSTGPPRIQSEELFNIENPTSNDSIHSDYVPNNDNYLPNLDFSIEEIPIHELSNHEEPHPEIDDQDFHVLASEPPSDL